MKRKKLSDSVAEEILVMIKNKEYDSEGFLPSEQKLLEKFEVSRVTVREAVKTLEVRGLVKRIHGKGILVVDNTANVLIRSIKDLIATEGTSLDEMLEVRDIVEPKCAEIAAIRRTEEDLLVLREKLEIMESCQLPPQQAGRGLRLQADPHGAGRGLRHPGELTPAPQTSPPRKEARHAKTPPPLPGPARPGPPAWSTVLPGIPPEFRFFLPPAGHLFCDGPAAGHHGHHRPVPLGREPLRRCGGPGGRQRGAHRRRHPLDGGQRLQHHPPGPGAPGCPGPLRLAADPPGDRGRPAPVRPDAVLLCGAEKRRAALCGHGGSHRRLRRPVLGRGGAAHLPGAVPADQSVPEQPLHPQGPETHPGPGGHRRPPELHDPHVPAAAGGPGRGAGEDQRQAPGQPHRPARHPEGAARPGPGHQRHAGPDQQGVQRPDALRLRRQPRAAHPHRRHPGLRRPSGPLGQGRSRGPSGVHPRHPLRGQGHGGAGGAAPLPGPGGQRHPAGQARGLRPHRPGRRGPA